MAMNLEKPSLYPLFMDLKDKPCLIVGAGAIGLQKANAMLRCGAALTITAIDVCDGVLDLAAAGSITLNHRPYEDGEAGDYHVIIAATEDNGLNRRIWTDGHAKNRLVNVVDVPSLCDFHVPAIVRRGRLQVAISTEGASPSIAKRIKRDIDGILAQRYDRLLDELMELRLELKQTCDSLQERMTINAAIAESPAVDQFLDGNETPLKELIDRALTPHRNQS